MPIDQCGPEDHEALQWQSIVQQPTSTISRGMFKTEEGTDATINPGRKIRAKNDGADFCCVGRGKSLQRNEHVSKPQR
jgi:hypothetical protein